MYSNTIGMFRVKGKRLHGLKSSKNDQTVMLLNHYLTTVFSENKEEKDCYIWINSSYMTLTLGKKKIISVGIHLKECNLLYYKWQHFLR